MSTALDFALDYVARGWPVIPIKLKTKAPRQEGWPSLALRDEAVVRRVFSSPRNVGVLLGGGLCDVDLDCPEALAVAGYFVPPTGMMFGRPSKRMAHRIYVSDAGSLIGKATEAYYDPDAPKDAGPLLELRVGGKTAAQTVFPPSIHPSGEPVTFEGGFDKEPATVDGAGLMRCCELVAAAALIARAWPAEGGHHPAQVLGGFLARAGMDEPSVDLFASAVLAHVGGPNAKEHVRTARDAAKAHGEGRHAYGFPELTTWLGEKRAKAVAKWLRYSEAAAPTTSKAKAAGQRAPRPRTATHPIEDFIAYLPEGKVIHRPTRALWVPKSVNSVALPPTRGTAFDWLAENNAVDQMTWAPGEPEIIEGRLFDEGGWVQKAGARVFNLYRPPPEIRGDAEQAGRWVEHVTFLYPDAAEHLFNWFAHRVQRPAEKINHALVLGGAQRIGKDSILVPVRAAVGEWNFKEIAAHRLLDRFNGWLKSVVLRVNEAHDMGELNRFQFYERIKGYTAAPPEVLSIDEKNVRAYAVPNVAGLVLTTNHKTDGMYLPADDHRHYVAWSDRTLDDFEDGYFVSLHRWFATGGSDHVAAWLATRDISEFDPKKPPPQTDAWWEIVLAGQSPEKTELADIIAGLGNPDALTIGQITSRASTDGSPVLTWLNDRKMIRQIPHRLEEAGYIAVRNPYERERGRWKINGRNQTIYAKKSLSAAQRMAAATRLSQSL
jgi:hypothetical protein